MQPTNRHVSRRGVLRAFGGAFAGTGIAGVDIDLPSAVRRVNVGYRGRSGRRAALEAAVDLVYEFAFDAVTMTATEADLRDLDRRDDVRYVEPDAAVEAIAQRLPYGVDRVDAEVAHANGDTGGGADVAIIDTGIDATHPDLADNLGAGRSFVGGTGQPLWQDDNGHGTHCAGIADAVDDTSGVVGVSTAATLHAVKVLTATGAGLTSDVAKGVEYTADQGWDVGSLSLGGPESALLREACDYAYSNGVLVVAAAGNDGECTDCVGYPAAYPTVVAVSATDSQDRLAGFSSTGPQVELAAPGASIYSTYLGGTYTELSGTSMACPHVSGAGAQLMAAGYTNTGARDRLSTTAEDIGLASNEQGNGLLDVAAALGHGSSDDLS